MADDSGVSMRLAATVLYAVISGAWIIASYERAGVFHDTAAAISVLVLGAVVAFYVRSWWTIFSLVGPLVALGYLEVSGFVGTSGDWAAEPLLSPRGVFVFIVFGTALLVGRALRDGADWVLALWRGRGRDDESAPW